VFCSKSQVKSQLQHLVKNKAECGNSQIMQEMKKLMKMQTVLGFELNSIKQSEWRKPH
jgi:hypothetical protein